MVERDAAANLSEEENELFKEFFESHGLSRINYMRLLRAGQWVDTPPDGHLTREGSPNPRVRLMTKGEARVHVGDDEVSVGVLGGKRCVARGVVWGECGEFGKSVADRPCSDGGARH